MGPGARRATRAPVPVEDVTASGDAAVALFSVGLLLVVAHNLLRWRRDVTRVVRLMEERRIPRGPDPTARVSILVAGWNEAALIDRHLESVGRLRYPDLEYVACLGGNDGTYELATRYARGAFVLLEQHGGEGKQQALRRCLEQARGDICFFTDADCMLQDDVFERTLGPILRGEADASSGGSRALPEQLATSFLAAYRSAAEVYAAAHRPRHDAGLLGNNCAATRVAVERAGGLRDSVGSGTDYHLAKQLAATGARFVQVPDSMISTRYPTTLAEYARRQRRWLRNVVLLGVQFGAYGEAAAALATSAVGIALLVLPFTALAVGPLALMAWLLALLHGGLSKMRYLSFAARLDPTLARWLTLPHSVGAVAVTAIELAIWALPVVDYVRPRGRARW